MAFPCLLQIANFIIHGHCFTSFYGSSVVCVGSKMAFRLDVARVCMEIKPTVKKHVFSIRFKASQGTGFALLVASLESHAMR